MLHAVTERKLKDNLESTFQLVKPKLLFTVTQWHRGVHLSWNNYYNLAMDSDVCYQIIGSLHLQSTFKPLSSSQVLLSRQTRMQKYNLRFITYKTKAECMLHNSSSYFWFSSCHRIILALTTPPPRLFDDSMLCVSGVTALEVWTVQQHIFSFSGVSKHVWKRCTKNFTTNRNNSEWQPERKLLRDNAGENK